jgi:CRISPR-associated exonuclease Cas4
LDFERGKEEVQLGKILHLLRLGEEEEVDFTTFKLDKVEGDLVLELKKSGANLEGARWQLLYYLFRLKKMGIEKRGVLEILEPRHREPSRVEVELTPQLEREMEKILKKIEEIISSPTPPIPQKSKKCRKCAYLEYCFGV